MPDFDGVHIDFDMGAHIAVPAGHSPVKYKIIDTSDNHTEDEGIIEAPDPKEGAFSHVSTIRKYYIPWQVEIESNGGMYVHKMDLKDKSVIIDLRSALGDSIAWMRSVELFTEKHKCKTTVVQKRAYIPLFKDSHPDYKFIAKEDWEEMDVPDDCYARYICATDCMGDGRRYWQPADYSKISVQACGDIILGVDSKKTAPRVSVSEDVKKSDTLICIACRASAPCKEWQYPHGWDIVVAELNKRGYCVTCIDGDHENLPYGAIDCTGYFPLPERAELLKKARLFIGLPSGLSWLAFAVGTPYVLIDGMSDPAIEAPTPFVCIPKYGKCRNCWGFADQKQRTRYQRCFNYWGGYDYVHKEPTRKFGENTFEQYECTKSITPDDVLKQIERALTKCI